jgi:bla regulator protein BlaR1
MMAGLWHLSVVGTGTFLAVGLAQRFLAPVMQARWRRLWWLLAAAAFLLPLEFQVPFPALVSPKIAAAWPSSWNAASLSSLELSSSLAAPRPWLPHAAPAALAGLWLAGAACFVGIALARTWSASRRWSGLRLSTDSRMLQLLEDCKAAAKVRIPVGLVVHGSIASPAVMGWLHPRILLPDSLADADAATLRPLLLHELAHVRGHDIALNWVFLLVRALHWFNPFAHWAARGWEQFREEAADETAIRWMADPDGSAYGALLLGLLQNTRPHPAPFGALGIGENNRNLKRRIHMISLTRTKHPRPLLGLSIAAFVAACWTLSPLHAATEDPEAAKKEAAAAREPWLQEIDRGKYAESWKDSSKMFQKAVTSEQWVAALGSVRTPLGACSGRKLASAMVQKEVPQPGKETLKGNFVIAQFESSYANMKYALETVTFEQEADGIWRASGYYIKPR